MLRMRNNGGFPVLRLRHDWDRAVFGDLFDTFQDWLGEPSGGAFPAVNVWEDERTVYAEAELPGLKMDDIEVLVLGDELTIKGDRKAEAAEHATYHRRERGTGSFSRVVRLPVDVDAGKVQATLRDGVLTVSLPKTETAVPRKIAVKAS